jgi:hypothetical protein
VPRSAIPEKIIDGHRLGRQINHDPRSRAYRYRRVPTALQSVTHLPSIPCLDQGDVGSCVANTGTELLATDAFAAVTHIPTLDEAYAQALYHDCTAADDYPGTWPPTDTGSDGTTLGAVLKTRGLASGYQHAMDPASFLDALQTCAVPIGITWKSGCDNPSSTGLIRWTGSVRGGHELLACGYDADRQWVMLQNHWGSSWGVGGRCWISVADLTAALANDGDATIIIPATQPAPTPAPTPVDVDAQLWAAEKSWASARHTGSNKTVAQALTAWSTAKGFTA